MIDYYTALRLKADCTAEEIKRAYRELAKSFHPDLYDGDERICSIFAEINQAYETLSDPARRAQYDAARPIPGHAEWEKLGFADGYAAGFKAGAHKKASVLAESKNNLSEAERAAASYKDEADSLRAELIRANTGFAEKLSSLAEANQKAGSTLKKALSEAAENQRLSSELKIGLEQAEAALRRAEAEKKYFESKYRAVATELENLTENFEECSRRLASWEDYGKTLDADGSIREENKNYGKLLTAYRKKVKGTAYETLGVLFFASDEDLASAAARLKSKAERKGDEELRKAVIEAAEKLSPENRPQYDLSLGITEEEKKNAELEQTRHLYKLKELKAEKTKSEFSSYIKGLTAEAEAGSSEAQNELGELFLTGEEVERDPKKAFELFREAARQKNPDGLYNLGVCFLNGQGCAKNAKLGTEFLRQASARGCARADEILERDA